MLSDFYKNNPSDKIWWVDDLDQIGQFLFSFDKKKIFNMFADYPDKLSLEQKRVFDKENPFWADFFSDRQPKVKSDSAGVDRFKSRRQERLDAKRKSSRMDADDENGGGNHGNTHLPYGIAKSEGIDTEGMTPKEVWEALAGKGYTPEETYKGLQQGKKATETKKMSAERKTLTRIEHDGRGIKGNHMADFKNPYVTDADREWVRKASDAWKLTGEHKYGWGDYRRFDIAGKEIRDIVVERFKQRKKAKDLPSYIDKPQIEDIYDVLRDIRPFGAPEEFKSKNVEIDSDLDDERTKEIMEEVYSRYPSEWFEKASKPLNIRISSRQGRSFYSEYDNTMTVFTSESDEMLSLFKTEEEKEAHKVKNDYAIANEIAHEMGHWFEASVSEIGYIAREMLEKRTAGLESETYDEYPTIRDSFFDPYMGKQYPWGGTEIISVLMQKIGYCDPLDTLVGKDFLSRKATDTKSLKFILGMLAGL